MPRILDANGKLVATVNADAHHEPYVAASIVLGIVHRINKYNQLVRMLDRIAKKCRYCQVTADYLDEPGLVELLEWDRSYES